MNGSGYIFLLFVLKGAENLVLALLLRSSLAFNISNILKGKKIEKLCVYATNCKETYNCFCSEGPLDRLFGQTLLQVWRLSCFYNTVQRLVSTICDRLVPLHGSH